MKKHLFYLNKTKLIDNVWFDGKIEAGNNIKETKKKYRNQADIILLMISASFIYHCSETEIKESFKQRSKDKIVIPIIIRPCLWEEIEVDDNKKQLGDNIKLPLNENAISSFDNYEEECSIITAILERLIKSKNKNPNTPYTDILEKIVLSEPSRHLTKATNKKNSSLKLSGFILSLFLLALFVFTMSTSSKQKMVETLQEQPNNDEDTLIQKRDTSKIFEDLPPNKKKEDKPIVIKTETSSPTHSTKINPNQNEGNEKPLTPKPKKPPLQPFIRKGYITKYNATITAIYNGREYTAKTDTNGFFKLVIEKHADDKRKDMIDTLKIINEFNQKIEKTEIDTNDLSIYNFDKLIFKNK